jgi:NitT/TauT family transport system substrate-binding protein
MSGGLNRRRFLLRSTAAFGSALLLKACGDNAGPMASSEADLAGASEPASTPAATHTIRFTLDWAVQGVHAPLGVAIENGYFAEEGLEVVFERGAGSADAITRVASGAFDMGFGDINSLMEFNVNNPDSQVRAVAMYYHKSPMSVMALRETGISEPQQLEGRRLGIPAGSATRRLMPLFAKTAGFDLSEVEIPAIESQLQQTLLLTKEIDAIAPFTISALPNLNEAGYGDDRLDIFRFVDYGLDLYGNAVLAPVSFIESNPDQVAGFVRALIRGLQDTLQDPDRAVEIMAGFDDLFDPVLERERLQIAIDTLFLGPEVEANGFGAIDPERFRRTIDQVVEGFELATTPAIEDIFEDRFLPPITERMLETS